MSQADYRALLAEVERLRAEGLPVLSPEEVTPAVRRLLAGPEGQRHFQRARLFLEPGLAR